MKTPPIKPGFINKLIKQRLLAKFPGFAASGQGDLFVSPVNHIWRGFSFQKSSGSPMWYVWYNVLPLYMPIEFSHIGLGGRVRFDRKYFAEWFRKNIQIYDPPGTQRPPPATNSVEVWVWDHTWDESTEQEAIDDLVAALRTAKAQYLDKLASPLEIGTNGPKLFGTEGWNSLQIFAFSLAYAGRCAEALPILENLIALMEQKRAPGEERSQHQCSCEKIRDLLKTDHEVARRQLLEWEKRSISVLRLEKHAG